MWCPWQSDVIATGGGIKDRMLHIWNISSVKSLETANARSQVNHNKTGFFRLCSSCKGEHHVLRCPFLSGLMFLDVGAGRLLLSPMVFMLWGSAGCLSSQTIQHIHATAVRIHLGFFFKKITHASARILFLLFFLCSVEENWFAFYICASIRALVFNSWAGTLK